MLLLTAVTYLRIVVDNFGEKYITNTYRLKCNITFPPVARQRASLVEQSSPGLFMEIEFLAFQKTWVNLHKDI